MQVHENLKELLEAYESFLDEEHYLNAKEMVDYDIDQFLASNCLALGKPEPLAKNKQCDNDFYCRARNPNKNSVWNFECEKQCEMCKNHSIASSR